MKILSFVGQKRLGVNPLIVFLNNGTKFHHRFVGRHKTNKKFGY
jgi:hypothetical protein